MWATQSLEIETTIHCTTHTSRRPLSPTVHTAYPETHTFPYLRFVPGMMRRASSQELLSSTPPVPLLKKGVSQESVFSGKDVDPLYATIGETGFGNTVR